MFVSESIAAATAVAQYDGAGNTWWQIHDRPRVMRRFGLVGGTAVSQFVVEVSYGTRRIGVFRNTTSGAVEPLEADMKWTLGNEVCPVGTPIHVIFRGSPTTNAAGIHIDFAEI